MRSRLLAAVPLPIAVGAALVVACGSASSGGPAPSPDTETLVEAGSDALSDLDAATDATPSWTPKDLTNVIVWLDADKGITESGAKVGAWADQSGKGQDVTTDVGDAAGACTAPELKKGASNGHAALHFGGQGANTCLSRRAATAFATGRSDFVVEMVVRQEAGGFFEGQMWAEDGPNDFKVIMYGPADESAIGVFSQMMQGNGGTIDRATATKKVPPGGFHVVGTRRKGDHVEVRVDGVATIGSYGDLADLDVTGPVSFTIGHTIMGGGRDARLRGDIAEIVALKDPTEADIGRLESYFQTKHGLATAGP